MKRIISHTVIVMCTGLVLLTTARVLSLLVEPLDWDASPQYVQTNTDAFEVQMMALRDIDREIAWTKMRLTGAPDDPALIRLYADRIRVHLEAQKIVARIPVGDRSQSMSAYTEL